jgi:DNA-binding transcriptional regulator YhcF (GntR family)
MPKKQLRQTTASRNHAEPPRPGASLAIPAEAALSFLKDTKGALTWTIRDLAATLNINRSDADRVIALLQAQGYVQLAHANGEWMTTPSGETVSGAKPPRFDRTSVEGALASLQERIKQMNKDAKGLFKVTTAVAFGDFLVKDRQGSSSGCRHRIVPARRPTRRFSVGLRRTRRAGRPPRTSRKDRTLAPQTIRRLDEEQVPSQFALSYNRS